MLPSITRWRLSIAHVHTPSLAHKPHTTPHHPKYDQQGMSFLTHLPFTVMRHHHVSRNSHGLPLLFSTDSLMTACHCLETLLHFGPRASHSSNCYYHQDLHHRLFHTESPHPASTLPMRFLLLITTNQSTNHTRCDRKVLGNYDAKHSSVIHFRDSSIRQVSCYTLLGGSSNFRGHRPAVSINQLPFWRPCVPYFRPLNFPFGSSHIASSAYQIRPTNHLLYFPPDPSNFLSPWVQHSLYHF